MFLHMVLEMRGFVLPYGFLSSNESSGYSVASARDAKVSMIKLTQSICTARNGESWFEKGGPVESGG